VCKTTGVRKRVCCDTPHTFSDAHARARTHAHMHSLKFARAQRHIDTQTYRHTDTQTRRHTGAQTHSRTDTHTQKKKKCFHVPFSPFFSLLLSHSLARPLSLQTHSHVYRQKLTRKKINMILRVLSPHLCVCVCACVFLQAFFGCCDEGLRCVRLAPLSYTMNHTIDQCACAE